MNDNGVFDILPMHANFISLINSYILLNKGTRDEKKYVINKGVLRVKENNVDGFLET
jgi:F0F1-type ATP synthase epsilon subunit